jgi:hypothetical protein
MSQKNIAFAPDLLPVLVGTAVDFPNLDDTYHNVFSYSKAKRFDLGRYRKDERPTTVVFDKPGVVTIHCEIHERMRGTILVLETPYFVKTDTTGRYRARLPSGRQTLGLRSDDLKILVEGIFPLGGFHFPENRQNQPSEAQLSNEAFISSDQSTPVRWLEEMPLTQASSSVAPSRSAVRITNPSAERRL